MNHIYKVGDVIELPPLANGCGHSTILDKTGALIANTVAAKIDQESKYSERSRQMTDDIQPRPPVGQRQPSTKPLFGTVRKPLGGKRPTRHIRQNSFLRMVGAAKREQGGHCAGHLAGIDHECDNLGFAHFVDQRVIARVLGEGHPALADERLGVYACDWINGALDEWRGELRDLDVRQRLRDQAHPEFDAALIEYGLGAEADRKFQGA